jgi:hypothetical protein
VTVNTHLFFWPNSGKLAIPGYFYSINTYTIGGVFILVNNNIIATEQVQYITKCEIEWIKIKLKDAKDLLIGAFYMPHRNINEL